MNYFLITRSLAFLCLPVFIDRPRAAEGEPSATPAAVYAYRQTAGTKVDTVFRSVASSAEGIIITFKEASRMATRAVCDSNLHIRSWHFEGKEIDFNVTARRTADTITIMGKKGADPFKKSLVIDSLPWYQAMEFSLLSFLKQGVASCKFWIIRPTDMKAFKMAVTRKNVESVDVNGHTERAIKVVLSPSGILGGFWHAVYWYRENDCRFLKSCMPGGSGTITEAIETPQ